VPSRIPTTTAAGAFPEDSFKYSPLEHVSSLFIAFYQGLFSASPLGAYHWSSDDDLTEIYISGENPLKDTSMGARPGLSFTLGPVQFYSLGLDDMMSYDPATGTKRKSVLVPGTMTINALSRVPTESKNIAWVCAEQLWLHREMLMAEGFFEIGRQPGIGSVSSAGALISSDSADEWYATSVACPFQFYRTSQTSPLNKQILQGLQLNLRQRLATIRSQSKDGGGQIGTPGPGLPFEFDAHYPPAFAPAASDVYGGTPQPGELAPELLTVPDPRNPAQRVFIRSSRPNSPAVRPPSIGGRPIPLAAASVEQSNRSPVQRVRIR
jgi:hypothetical protein